MPNSVDDLTWQDFEATLDGKLWIENDPFYMRVGRFMGRPMQVIQSPTQFIRMRLAPEFEGHALKILNPQDPYICTYPKFNQELGWFPPKSASKLSDIVTATLRNRTGELANSLTRNNALLKRLTK